MNLKTMLSAILLLGTLALSQKCLNHAGQEVNWFVILRSPGVKSPSYHYYDNNTRGNFAFYTSSPDQPNHPIYNTFTSLSKSNHDIIAWNDQIQNGSTSSSKAHSKTVIGYNLATNSGIVAVHSFPNYPIITGHTINPKIAASQSVYGQHFFCFNSGAATKDILRKSGFMNPNYYGNKSKIEIFTMSTRLFEFSNLDVGSNRMKIIFKNGKMNGSIFEDGLTMMLSSNLVAATWRRNSSSPWCGSQNNKYKVGNVVNVTFDNGVAWKDTQDHSKWVVPINQSSSYSCFGDMNRMDSQFRRGGAFYCIQDAGLNKAMKKIIKAKAVCP